MKGDEGAQEVTRASPAGEARAPSPGAGKTLLPAATSGSPSGRRHATIEWSSTWSRSFPEQLAAFVGSPERRGCSLAAQKDAGEDRGARRAAASRQRDRGGPEGQAVDSVRRQQRHQGLECREGEGQRRRRFAEARVANTSRSGTPSAPEKRAEELEDEAAFAIDYAVSSIEQTRLAALDAIAGRLEARRPRRLSGTPKTVRIHDTAGANSERSTSNLEMVLIGIAFSRRVAC